MLKIPLLALAVVATASVMAFAATEGYRNVTAQEIPPDVVVTNPWADDSPCSLASRYYVGSVEQWESGVCSTGQQANYDAEVEEVLSLFAKNDAIPSGSPCSANFVDVSKHSGSSGFRPGQAITQPDSITCSALLNIPVTPVDRFGNAVPGLVLVNGLRAGFDPGPAPYYHGQAVGHGKNNRCAGLTANACLELLALLGEVPANHVADLTPAPALPPEVPNNPAPVREMAAENFVPGGLCFGLSYEACWSLVHPTINH